MFNKGNTNESRDAGTDRRRNNALRLAGVEVHSAGQFLRRSFKRARCPKLGDAGSSEARQILATLSRQIERLVVGG